MNTAYARKLLAAVIAQATARQAAEHAAATHPGRRS